MYSSNKQTQNKLEEGQGHGPLSTCSRTYKKTSAPGAKGVLTGEGGRLYCIPSPSHSGCKPEPVLLVGTRAVFVTGYEIKVLSCIFPFVFTISFGVLPTATNKPVQSANQPIKQKSVGFPENRDKWACSKEILLSFQTKQKRSNSPVSKRRVSGF